MPARNMAVPSGSMSGRCRQPSSGAASCRPIGSSSTCGGESTSRCSARHRATRTAVLSGINAMARRYHTRKVKFGLLLHPERGVDAVLNEAREADRQGFDSVWLFDHLMDWRGHHGPDGPYDSFTLMTAIGAVTRRVRLAWAMLNPSFRHPAVLAKSLATLDHITRGRVICSLGA